MELPTKALGPDGKMHTILVDEDGKLVTDVVAKPLVTFPITKKAARVDADGNLLTT